MSWMQLLYKIPLDHWRRKASQPTGSKNPQENWPSFQSSGTAYTLKRWPEIGPDMKMAGHYRALSLLSQGPVCFDNLKRCLRDNTRDAVVLLKYLEKQGVLSVVHIEWNPSPLSLEKSLGDKWHF